jgi:thiosulfate/3-mercaptopyruvate sulfurtransferase
VEPAWLEGNLHAADLVVLHVEAEADPDDERDRYEDGHVPGARLLPWRHLGAPPGAPSGALPALARRIATVRMLGIRGGERIVIYDAGRGFEAARAFLVLDSLGLADRTSLLNGQWAQWRDEGRPRTTSVPAPAPSDFHPRAVRASVASRTATRDYLWATHQDPPAATILDLRSLRQAGWTDGVPDPLPGSVRVPWEAILSCAAAARLPDEDRLRRVFRPAAPFEARPMLVVGATPAEAAFGWFTARLLGYPARVSEETFEEWAASTHPREWSDPERHGLAPPEN